MTDLTIALDDATDSALEKIAEATKRPKAQVAADALSSYLRDQVELEAMVQEARDDFEAGRTFSSEEVAAGTRAIIDAARTRKG